MAYYVRDITRTCQHQGCSSTATTAVYASGTAHFGDFCSKHAKARIKMLEAAEKKAERAEAQSDARMRKVKR